MTRRHFRLVITGSRGWKTPHRIYADLTTAWIDTVFQIGGILHISTGACPEGADYWADRWARSGLYPDVIHERHPARWREHDADCGHPTAKHPCHEPDGRICRAAGFRRNDHMIAKANGEADSVLTEVRGYWDGHSAGTRECLNEARAAERLTVVQIDWATRRTMNPEHHPFLLLPT